MENQEGITADFRHTLSVLDEVVEALKCGGYDPYAQIYGFLQTGEDCYITRRNGAREKIKTLDRNMIRRYLEAKMPGTI